MTRLTLSGGGFRATLFHLGVIRHLCESGELSQVTEIVSVSGGSVLAAHVVLHWDDYVNPARFGDRAKDVVNFVQRDVRNRIFIRWLMPLLVPGFVLPLTVIMLAAGGALPVGWAWSVAPLGMLAAIGWFFLGLFARVKALTKQYRSLFGNRELRELGGLTPNNLQRPVLYVATTSLKALTKQYRSLFGNRELRELSRRQATAVISLWGAILLST